MRLHIKAYLMVVAIAGGLAACKDNGSADVGARNAPVVGETADDERGGNGLAETSTSLIKPIFPDASAASEMQLDYETFRRINGEGISIVPLPPHFAPVTRVHVDPHEGGYQIVAGSAQCQDAIVLSMGGREVAILDPKTGDSFVLEVDAELYPDGAELSVDMASSAQANFACGINLVPTSASQAN